MMEDDRPFVDYYAILQVDPECNPRALEAAYHRLAKTYHPDHPDTADLDRFNIVTRAYGLLRRPEKRAAYDVLYARFTGYPFPSRTVHRFEAAAAISDAHMHANILLYLYKKRRECARHPGVGIYDLLRTLECSEDSFEFHAWYLKRKGFIEITDDGTYAITVEGVDHVITTSQSAEKTLRITHANDAELEQWAEREVGVLALS